MQYEVLHALPQFSCTTLIFAHCLDSHTPPWFLLIISIFVHCLNFRALPRNGCSNSFSCQNFHNIIISLLYYFPRIFYDFSLFFSLFFSFLSSFSLFNSSSHSPYTRTASCSASANCRFDHLWSPRASPATELSLPPIWVVACTQARTTGSTPASPSNYCKLAAMAAATSSQLTLAAFGLAGNRTSLHRAASATACHILVHIHPHASAFKRLPWSIELAAIGHGHYLLSRSLP